MPSIGHVMMGLAAGRLQARRPRELAGSMVLFALVSLLPDLDVVAFSLGIPYQATFGHRGASHSVGMAAVVAAALALAARAVRRSPWRIGLTAFGALVAHDLADALTDGGLGAALLWPLSDRRIFLPWRPIPVAPIGLLRLLSAHGLGIMLAELVLFSPFLAYALWPRRASAEVNARSPRRAPGRTPPALGAAGAERPGPRTRRR